MCKIKDLKKQLRISKEPKKKEYLIFKNKNLSSKKRGFFISHYNINICWYYSSQELAHSRQISTLSGRTQQKPGGIDEMIRERKSILL